VNAGVLASVLYERAAVLSHRSQAAGRGAVAVAPLGAGVLLWALSFRSIDLSRIGDFGLLSALPWTFYAGLALLTLGFALALGKPRLSEATLAAHVVALILVLYGTPTIAYGTLRYAWAWKHVGIVDYIQRHGSVDPSISFLNAYHNWPGFFALSALYTQLAGFGSALSFASWAPPFFNLLFCGALVLLFRALTTDRRRVWLGVWLFFCTSWVGQDYFAPQAFSYFLFLVAVTVCVAWFRLREPPTVEAVRRLVRSPGWATRLVRTAERADVDARWHSDASRGERAAMTLLVVGLATVVAVSHQLTPFMLMLALGGLVVVQRIGLRSLPLLVAVISIGWVALFAVAFLRGNLYWIADSLGTLTTNTDSTLINLAQASHGQQVVARVDRGLTLMVWLLGAAGFARMARNGRLELSAGVLALSPFGMIAANAYGGEILFRVYFFALPFASLLAAGLFYPEPLRGDARAAAAAGLVSAVLLGGFLFAYYGKERQNYFAKGEVRAARLLYRVATPGSLLVAGVNNYPWAFTHYERYSYLSLADLLPRDRRRAIADPADTISSIARRARVPCAYVVITASQKGTVDMTGVMPPGSLTTIQHRLAASRSFRQLVRNPSAVVFGMAVERLASERSAAACHLEAGSR